MRWLILTSLASRGLTEAFTVTSSTTYRTFGISSIIIPNETIWSVDVSRRGESRRYRCRYGSIQNEFDSLPHHIIPTCKTMYIQTNRHDIFGMNLQRLLKPNTFIEPILPRSHRICLTYIRLFNKSIQDDENNDHNNDYDDTDDDLSDHEESQVVKRSYGTSEWIVPKYVPIPEDQLEFSFVRSSGAGGQNVNKVNTQVQIRFHVVTANWLPNEVRQRLLLQQSNRINNAGYITIAVQEYRTQIANRKEAISKLHHMIMQAWIRPKIRKLPKVGLSEVTKIRRKDEKQKRKQKKELRRGPVDFY